MSGSLLANATLVVLFIGITAYALFGGADFGGGFWDLFAGNAERGAPQRARIERSIGPVWEANHVWLIFALVIVWTSFPTVFSSVASTCWIPLTLVAFGVIVRGSAFAFRKTAPGVGLQRLFGACFALSSVITPFFLGTVAGAIASGRVPVGIEQGSVITSWLNATSVLGGVLAVGTAAFLAAAYLAADAASADEGEIADAFRVRTIASGLAVGAVALLGIAVLHSDAPRLFDGLTHRAAPLIAVSALCGGGTVLASIRRRHSIGRVLAAGAVIAVLWGWALGQYPSLLVPGSDGVPGLDVAAGATSDAVLGPVLTVLGLGALFVVPSLAWLYLLTQRGVADVHAE